MKFLRIEAAGFCKNGGVATSVDVMLGPMVRCLGVGFTSTVRKIEGNFCTRVFTSSGTESGIFLIRGGRVLQRLVFPKTEAGQLHLGIPD